LGFPSRRSFFASALRAAFCSSLSTWHWRFSRFAHFSLTSSFQRRTAALPLSEVALLESPARRGTCEASRAETREIGVQYKDGGGQFTLINAQITPFGEYPIVDTVNTV